LGVHHLRYISGDPGKAENVAYIGCVRGKIEEGRIEGMNVILDEIAAFDRMLGWK
jgi:hypothetical protein